MGIFDFLDYFRLPTQLLRQRDVPSNTGSLVHVPPCTHADISPSKPAMHVPIEVVIHILNLACDGEAANVNRTTLANCALVCKEWSFVAQELLFRDVKLGSETAFKSFEDAVSYDSPRGCALAGAVKQLYCIVDDKQPRGLSLQAFTKAVTSCPNLQSLHIALYSASADLSSPTAVEQIGRVGTTTLLDEDLMSRLRAGPRFTSLRFDNWSNDDNALIQLLHNTPFITALSISGKTPSLPSLVYQLSPCALQELRVNFQTAPSTDFFSWLLQNSKSTLRSLDFQREPSCALLEYFITEHYATLESLALPACASREAAALLSRCAQLRELRLENAWVAPGVHRELPSSLERLALAVDKDTPLQPILRAIKRGEALSAITLHVWAEGERHPQMAAVKIACATRGIQLKVMRDIRVFRTIKRGYPIHGVQFCRAKIDEMKNA